MIFYEVSATFFETGFLCVALAVLEFILYTRLASNSEIYLLLPSRILGLQASVTKSPVLLVQSMDLLVTSVSWLLLILSKISGPVALF